LVGHHRALGRQHPRAHVVLGGDELDVLLLAAQLVAQGIIEFVVEPGDLHVRGEHSAGSAEKRCQRRLFYRSYMAKKDSSTAFQPKAMFCRLYPPPPMPTMRPCPSSSAMAQSRLAAWAWAAGV